jgi:hypothetical protein
MRAKARTLLSLPYPENQETSDEDTRLYVSYICLGKFLPVA